MTKLKITELEQWGPIEARILYQSFWFMASVKYVNWPDMLAVYDHDRVVFYWSKEKMQRGGERALSEIINSKKRDKLWREYLALIKAMRSASRRGLISAGQWYEYLNLFWRITLVVETANFAAPEYLRKKLKKLVPPEKLDGVLEIMLAPEKLSFHQQSELELLKAANMESYARKWFWVENSYYESKILTANDFKSRIKFLSQKAVKEKLEEISNYAKKVKRKKAAMDKKYNLPREIMRQAAAMAFSIWWQDHRKSIIWWSNSITDLINKNLSRRFNLTENDLMHYTAEEWAKLSENNVIVPKKIINQRKKIMVFEFLGNGFKLYYGNQARKVINKWLPKARKQSKNKFLPGIAVSAGKGKKIRGRVRVLHSARNINKMKRGEILVAPMTSPDYIQAMRRAKAIITDVGGLMSHAAVVSRELSIPCIVNTKIATRVLRDGDLVEMDAEKGIVRLLRKASVDK